MTERVAATLRAMRASAIPEAESGLWRIRKFEPCRPTKNANGQTIPPGRYTALSRTTLATLHTDGASVMSDDPVELRRHLDFVLRARGRVLVTGLGLGCVLRGLLQNPRVESIDVVERDRDVLALVRPYLAADRYRIHEAEALAWVRDCRGSTWDYAWHDLWSDVERGDPHLAITHQRLILALRGRVEFQGAWSFPRYLQRLLRERFPASRAWAR